MVISDKTVKGVAVGGTRLIAFADALDKTPFYVEAIRNAPSSVQICKAGGLNLEYSLDGVSWTLLQHSADGTVKASVPAGCRLYLRGDNPAGLNPGGQDTVGATVLRTMLASRVGGNLLSLLYPRDFGHVADLSATQYAFAGFFNSCQTLVSARDLRLPPVVLGPGAYYNTFISCHKLIEPPATLPATVLAEWCYYQTFSQCENLLYPPALPELAVEKYATLTGRQGLRLMTTNMFFGCAAIVADGLLPEWYQWTAKPSAPAATAMKNLHLSTV